VKLTTHLHLVPRSKNEWNYTFTTPIRLRGVVLSFKKAHGQLYLYLSLQYDKRSWKSIQLLLRSVSFHIVAALNAFLSDVTTNELMCVDTWNVMSKLTIEQSTTIFLMYV